MRTACILILLAACEPALRHQALPELVVAAKPEPLAVPMLRLEPGETMLWDIHMQGFTIGRAELDVGEHEVRSKFATAGIASTLSRVRHELATQLDPSGAHALSAVDTLDVDGDHTRTETVFGGHRPAPYGSGASLRSDQGQRITSGPRVLAVPPGNVGHTLHTALGVIRAWASPQARSGFLYIVHAGELFRIDFQPPTVEDLRDRRTLRVEARVRGDTPISLSIWLSDSPDRVPLRIEVRAEGVRLTAELISA